MRKDFSHYYRSPSNEFLFRWVDMRKKQHINKKISLLKKGSRILEIGSGTGRIMEKHSKDYVLVCMDINPALLRICKKRNFLPVEGSADNALPFADGSFDAIITIDSIEHFLNRDIFMKETSRLLKKGGFVIHFTPPYDSFIWNIAEFFYKLVLRTNMDHISPFTGESIGFFMGQYFNKVEIKKLNLGLTMYAYGEKR